MPVCIPLSSEYLVHICVTKAAETFSQSSQLLVAARFDGADRSAIVCTYLRGHAELDQAEAIVAAGPVPEQRSGRRNRFVAELQARLFSTSSHEVLPAMPICILKIV